MLSLVSILALAILESSVLARPQGARRDISGPFKLYAYGTDISGLPIYYSNGSDSRNVLYWAAQLTSETGTAQIGDDSSNPGDKIPIYVTSASGDDPSTWIAHPDNTTSLGTKLVFSTDGVASNSNLVSCVNKTGLTNPVNFLNAGSNSSSDLTDVWTLYGTTVLISEDGANFYAQSTDEDGWYNLVWSSSVDASTDNVLLTLLAESQ
ncbi:hypothetical protein N7493_006649 [Penicillium malachiteum]|uniref:Uncharacterized protein n=1 Tax=Penicillium malachiteum TaxID=1324776 RepID=A0AAD6MVW6_9EURO|nr:hypothetical protein N7493_006649 [Penicillium malachiteum]